MATFEAKEATSIRTCIDRFDRRFRREVSDIVHARMRGYESPRVRELLDELVLIQRQLAAATRDAKVHDVHLRLLKHVLGRERRELAAEVDLPQRMTTDPDTMRYLQLEVRRLDAILASPQLADVEPAIVPTLADFLSLQYAEQELEQHCSLESRCYDEKFHILEAPHLCLPDLAFYRQRCTLRKVGIAVVYLDIDDFKGFNTRYTETLVDRDLLPPLMTALETHVFVHGHAYRFGGDEYVLTLPNVTLHGALRSMCELQTRLATVRYLGIEPAPTMSAGLCWVAPDSVFTDREILMKANAAKNHAKTAGKARVAYYDSARCTDADLRVATD